VVAGIGHLDDLSDEHLISCVVLAPTGGPEGNLTKRLQDLGVSYVVEHDALLALAELLLTERLDVTRAAWGLRPAGRVALVVESPESWSDLEDLMGAIDECGDDVLVVSARDRRESGVHPFRAGGAARDDSPAAEEERAFISNEEIAMLLGDADEDEETRGDRERGRP